MSGIKRERKSIQVICPARVDFTGGFTDVLPFRDTQWVNHINLAINVLASEIIEALEMKDWQGFAALLNAVREQHSKSKNN